MATPKSLAYQSGQLCSGNHGYGAHTTLNKDRHFNLLSYGLRGTSSQFQQYAVVSPVSTEFCCLLCNFVVGSSKEGWLVGVSSIFEGITQAQMDSFLETLCYLNSDYY